MGINANKLVNVLPRVITAGGNTLELNGIIISNNNYLPNIGLLEFESSKSVGKYFGTESQEYKISINYFLGWNNSTKKPRKILLAKDKRKATSGVLFGGKVLNTLAEFKLITTGTFDITIGNINLKLTDLDFSTATSLSNVATILQTAIRNEQTAEALMGAIVEYSSINKNFIITAGGTGENSIITFALNSTLASMLMLEQNQALFASIGEEAVSIATLMNNLKTYSLNWVSFMTIEEAMTSDKLEFAIWCNSQSIRFVYVCQDSDNNATIKNNETNISFKINELGLSGTTLQFNTANISAFVMGMIASINYDVVNGRITLAFKSQSGLAYSVNDDEVAEGLIANGYNFYGNYATSNDTYKLYQNSKMSGNFGWTDTYVNAVWLNDRLQTDLLNLLNAVNSLPYNNISYNKIISACGGTLNQALSNGVITQGVSLSSVQKIQLENEAGLDISDMLYTMGYYMQVLDPSAVARGNRESPIANIWYVDGGSIQKIELFSTTIL